MLCRLLQQHESAQLKQTAKHTAVTIFADVIWQLVRKKQASDTARVLLILRLVI